MGHIFGGNVPLDIKKNLVIYTCLLNNHLYFSIVGVWSYPLNTDDKNSFISILTEPQKQQLYEYLNDLNSIEEVPDSFRDASGANEAYLVPDENLEQQLDIPSNDKRSKWSIAYGKRSPGKWSIAYGKRAPGKWNIAYGKRAPGKWNIAYGKRAPGKWNIAYGKRNSGYDFGKRSPWSIAYGKRESIGDGEPEVFTDNGNSQYDSVHATSKRQQGWHIAYG